MNEIKADVLTLYDYLGKNTKGLYIPYSQRPYEWGKAEVKRLFDDLIIVSELNEMHMLNFFTLSMENNFDEIFDGQQRTLTILLFISVLCKNIYDLGDEPKAKEIYSTYILKKSERHNKENIKKLRFDEQLKDAETFFYKLTNYKNTENDIKDLKEEADSANTISKKTIKYLYKNYDYLCQLFNEYIKKNDNITPESIDELLGKIEENVKLVIIKTSTNQLAQQMFETLNNTGKSLDYLHVLKNDLALQLENNITNFKNTWTKIITNIDGQSQFLNYFVAMIVGEYNTKDILNKLYNIFDKNNSHSMNELLKLLEKASEKYKYIICPEYTLISNEFSDKEFISEYRECMQTLHILAFTQYRPILLALFIKEYPYNDIIKVLHKLIKLSIVYFAFSDRKTNKLRNSLFNLANNIYQNNLHINDILSNIIMMVDELALFEKDTSKFKQELINFRVTSTSDINKAKYVLRSIYNSDEIKVDNNNTKINYEHILPQSPNSNSQWIQDFPDKKTREDYCKKLGNGTLLLGTINKSISNSDFNQKKDYYTQSNILENNKIADNNIWTAKEIDNRTINIVDQFIKYLQTL